MADETPEPDEQYDPQTAYLAQEKFTPTTGLPIEQAPDYTDLPTQGTEDPAYGAAVRGETDGSEPEELEEGQAEADVPRWPFGIASLMDGSAALQQADELRQAGQTDQADEIERQVAAARENLARTPDGVEGELTGAGEDPALAEIRAYLERMGEGAQSITEGEFIQASRIGVGRATGLDEDGDMVDLIAVVMEIEPPAGVDEPTMRVVRSIDPAQAAKLARDLLNQVIDRVTNPDDHPPLGPEATEEPAAGEPDAPAALDTEE